MSRPLALAGCCLALLIAPAAARAAPVADPPSRLLVTAREAPARWGLTLADLESRMAGAGLVRIDPPDEALLAAVIVKLFADRQLEVSPRVVNYLTLRLERSFAAAQEIVARLDAAALAAGRAVSLDLAAALLADGDRADPDENG